MGKRGRRRAASNEGARNSEKLTAPSAEYTDPEGNTLTLRGFLSPAARREHAQTLTGSRSSAAATSEDVWQRASELLFERLAVSWTIAGAPIERQRELLARYRVASPSERAWVRDVLREHCAERFPDVKAP